MEEKSGKEIQHTPKEKTERTTAGGRRTQQYSGRKASIRKAVDGPTRRISKGNGHTRRKTDGNRHRRGAER